MLQERARGIDPRGLDQQTQRISISIENTFERDLTDRTQLHAELRRMAERLSQHLRDTGRTGRTVSTKLRYTDFSIRTRSTSLRVGIDDGEQIGELACGLLDRALTDRPGALRLVGVGVSGLAIRTRTTGRWSSPFALKPRPGSMSFGGGAARSFFAGST